MNNPRDGTESRVLMNPEQILAMTEMTSSSQCEETRTTEQQRKTRKKKIVKKKNAAKPGAVEPQSAELPSKISKMNSSSQLWLSQYEETTTEQQGKARKKSIKKKKVTKPDATASKSAELTSKEHEDSAQQTSSSKDKKMDDDTNDGSPGVKKSEATREATSAGAIRVEGMSATHQGGMDLEEGGSKMTVMVETHEESEPPPPVDAQDGTVTATAIARDDLEQEMRDQIFAEAVKAKVIKSGLSPAHKNRRWMILGCIILSLIIVGAVVGVVVAAATGDSGGDNAPTTGGGNAPTTGGGNAPTTGGGNAPTTGGGNAPTTGGGDAPTTPQLTERRPIFDYLKSQSPDGGMALSSILSPQHKAFVWLLGETPENERGELTSSPEQARILSRYAMATLYYSTNGAGWRKSQNWLSTSHISTWYPGNFNNSDANLNVLKLDLRANRLIGTLPDELVFLSSLQVIDIRRNQLTGSIPSEIARLVNLKELILKKNNLTNSLPPSFQSLSNLEIIDVYQNKLTGTIPLYVGSWPSIARMNFGYNNLTGVVDQTICQSVKQNKTRFIADCDEVDCPCCSLCCDQDGVCGKLF